jgi:copper homeostasis protein CutC
MDRELVIQSAEDLKKLQGWQIEAATYSVEGVDPSVRLKITHPAASCPVMVIIRPQVSFGRSGNIFLVNQALTIQTQDAT